MTYAFIHLKLRHMPSIVGIDLIKEKRILSHIDKSTTLRNSDSHVYHNPSQARTS